MKNEGGICTAGAHQSIKVTASGVTLKIEQAFLMGRKKYLQAKHYTMEALRLNEFLKCYDGAEEKTKLFIDGRRSRKF
ncbi:hypothetical protein AB6A40_009201 [Gnathostoma spinigerum]|uniref:Uncharacterized protein n=1 Tax=Gnathostoma spinigerum TaxID=75299 RepID=A0ABD6F0C5_9BILA